MSICCVWCLPQMTPLDVALNRGHVNAEKLLRGAGVSHVSTHVRVEQIRCLAVLDRNSAIFCCVFQSCYCIQSALVQWVDQILWILLAQVVCYVKWGTQAS